MGSYIFSDNILKYMNSHYDVVYPEPVNINLLATNCMTLCVVVSTRVYIYI